jgi:hypothetical protein
MSERDLPSRLLSEQNHIGDSRRNVAPHAPIQSSKSVPSLNSKYVVIWCVPFELDWNIAYHQLLVFFRVSAVCDVPAKGHYC